MLHDSRSEAYASATRPLNSSSPETPARVATISSPDDLPAAFAAVAELGRATGRTHRIAPQATGHGAGPGIDDGVVLLDTSALNQVTIDADARVATVGAGATWGAVNAAAERHGLLGPAGSAPSVSVSGYTFGGGIGWLVRRDGLASGALSAVHYADGEGRLRVARDDADDALDRDALWSFRGAGGAGIAHTLELDLFPAPALHAGALLWHARDLPRLIAAWAGAIGFVGGGVSSSVSVLHVPPLPVFPEELRGAVAVHLAVADPDGASGAAPLLDAMRAIARPLVDTWGPTDAAGLARIHLDPPAATPAIGDARWLDASTPGIAAELLSTAAEPDAPLVMMELRHVAAAPTRRDGAVTTPPGDFIYHAVAPLDRFPREGIVGGFARARQVWGAADTGLTPGSWIEGASSVPSALAPAVRERASAIADAIDPRARIRRSRLLG